MRRRCETEGCKREAAKYRKICTTCKGRKQTLKDPMRKCWQNLKGNAKYRGKPFGLTFEEFKELCVKSDYMNKKGITKEAYTLDCIINNVGYFKGNIQVIPNKDNVQKYLTIDRYWDGRKMHFYTRKVDLNNFSTPVEIVVPF